MSRKRLTHLTVGCHVLQARSISECSAAFANKARLGCLTCTSLYAVRAKS